VWRIVVDYLLFFFFVIQESSFGKVNLHYGIPNDLFVCDGHDIDKAVPVSPKNPQTNEVDFVASIGNKRKISAVCDDDVVCYGQSSSKVSKVSFD
jgi:hypothetical protein